MRTLQVVVADYAVARFYRLPDAAVRLELIDALGNPAARTTERELVSGRPGRIFNRGIGHTQSFDPRNRHKRIFEENFARAIARRIGRRLAAERADELIVVAGPRLLALIELRLSKAARQRLAATVPQDLARLGAAQLSRTLVPLRAALRRKVVPAV
ncbi:MAG TPA: host attachment protein [Steroidobacteraceae bacterium]|nr:host attachment protein [Steroidobacteraceae bacterium]